MVWCSEFLAWYCQLKREELGIQKRQFVGIPNNAKLLSEQVRAHFLLPKKHLWRLVKLK